MVLKTNEFDASKYLSSEEAIQEFLAAAFEGNDPVHIAKAIGVVAKARNMSELAREVGMTRAALYRAFNGETSPEFATIMKILGALGVSISPVIKRTDEAA